MAWRCTGKTNAELISNLARNGIFKSDQVAHAMGRVDRANYVQHKSGAYEDSPQRVSLHFLQEFAHASLRFIGYDATISAPHMHAYAAEHLLPFLQPGAKVLDVGSGSGYLTAVLHHLVSPSDEGTVNQGLVVGIDHIPELVDMSVANLKKDGLGKEMEQGKIKMITGDGRLGYKESGPYSAIHVGAAAPTMPQPLIDQLALPGRMFIPVGTNEQYIWQVDKNEKGEVSQTRVMGVMYVPLTDRKAQR